MAVGSDLSGLGDLTGLTPQRKPSTQTENALELVLIFQDLAARGCESLAHDQDEDGDMDENAACQG